MKRVFFGLITACLLSAGLSQAADDWSQKNPSPRPTARRYHRMAYAGEDQVLLFGGGAGASLFDQTWTYDLSESTWTQMNPTSKPSARAAHAMAHIGGNRVLLFGGSDADGYDDQTWVYDLDAGTWTQMNPAVRPSPRVDIAMAYLGTDQVLLFGGQDSSGYDDQTWAYDLGEGTWTQMNPIGGPTARGEHALAYLGSGQVLLFGGKVTGGSENDETWVYDLGTNTWTQKSPASKPSARHSHAMAAIGEDRVLLFSGYDGALDDESWVYDLGGDQWTLDSNTTCPTGRFGFGLSETSLSGPSYPVLFGGYDDSYDDETWTFGGGDYPMSYAPQVILTFPNGGQVLADSVLVSWTAADPDSGDSTLLLVDVDVSDDAGQSWTAIDSNLTNDGAHPWDISGLPDGESYLVRITAVDTFGLRDADVSDAVFTIDNPEEDWTRRFPLSSPSARRYHGMAYIGEHELLLFGGDDGALDDQTWLFRLADSTWALLSPPSKPTPRDRHAMAYIGEDQVLLFGGDDGAPDGQTWIFELSDTSWRKLTPPSAPSARHSHAMSFIGDDRVLLFGGDDGALDDQTWVFDLSDSTWTKKEPALSPSAREMHAMASIGGDQVLLFGGDDGSRDDQTWLYDLSENAWTQLDPASKPSARSGHRLAYMGADQVLLFGGTDLSGRDDQTWIFNLSDTAWVRDENTVQPSAREGHGLCQSSLDGSTYPVLFGGDDGAFDDQTWTFGGGDYFVPDPPQVMVLVPNGGEILADSITIAWKATDPDPGDSTLLLVDLEYSDDASDSWTAIDSGQVNDGLYWWDLAALVDADSYLVRISARDTSGLTGFDVSDTLFSINNDAAAPQATISYPNGGEILHSATTVNWTAVDADPGETALLSVDLDVSDDGGQTWSPIDSNLANDGSYDWDLSELSAGDQYLMRILATDTTGLADADSSDAVFTIITHEDDWTQVFPDPHPPKRAYTSLAFAGGDRLLLFGGWDMSQLLDDTWAYDFSQTTWAQKSPETKPSARAGHAMAYIGADQVLLFGGGDAGGLDDETWVYDLGESTWTLQNPPTKPSARTDIAMANIGADQVLLFGGDDGSNDDETWVYDLSENNWTQKSPLVKPSARRAHAMAKIGADQVLLFGGNDGSNDDETWVYDLSENTWTQKYPPTKPSARNTFSMAYLGADEVLLFGGHDGSAADDETWIYDLGENNWTQDINTTQPAARYGFGLGETSMAGTNYPVLFGGYDGSMREDTWIFGGGDYPTSHAPLVVVTHPNGGETVSDTVTIIWAAGDADPGDSTLLAVDLDVSADAGSTWALIDSSLANDGAYLWDVSELTDGDRYLVRVTATDTTGLSAADSSDAVFAIDNPEDDWVQHLTLSQPTAREHHDMAYIGQGQVLLFGGHDGALDDQTWLFDLSDSAWVQLDPASKPSARDQHAMAFLGGDQALLFGGDDGARDDQTWLFNLGDSSWAQLGLATHPSARRAHAMASIEENKVLLFGGDDGAADDQTWLFDFTDTSWTQLIPASGPTARSGHEMAYLGEKRVLLFGGSDDQTWLFDLDDSTWTSLPVVSAPSARHSHAMAYMGGDQALLFGGDDGARDDQTWVFDLGDTSWIQDFNDVQPSARKGHGLCQSSPDGSTYPVLFGGDDGTLDDETWTFGGGDYVVPDPPQVTVLAPNGGEVWADSAVIVWMATDPDPGETALLLVDLDVSANAGSTWAAIDSGLVNDGDHPWDLSGLADGDDYLVRITATDTSGLIGIDVSDSVFSINNEAEAPQAAVVYPNGGEILADSVVILWTATDPDPGETALLRIDLDFSDNAGIGWAVIDSALTNDGEYIWDLSGLAESSDYFIRMTVTDTSGLFDTDSCDAVFTVITSEDDWTQQFPDPHPPTRDYFPMAYIGEGKALLFAGWGPGNLNDTWVYDAITNTWAEQPLTAKPAGRLSHSMAYIGEDNALMFGGWNGTSESDDTWIYDLGDTLWRELFPATKPTGRKDMAMAYLGGDQVLLFGGDIGSEVDDDETWIFDLSDSAWTQLFPDTVPSERHGHCMISIDPGRALLFAGERHSKFVLNDETWLFDLSDTSWTQLFPENSPSGRSSHAMARLGDGLALAFGGSTSEHYYDDETWVFDLADTTWAQDANTIQPAGRYGHAMSETSLNGATQVVLFGGYSGSILSDTWTFGGGDYLVARPAVTLLFPNGGEVLADSVIITWLATDPNPGDSALLSVDLDYSDDGGDIWSAIDSNQANDGAHLWDVSGLSDGDNYLVRITVADTCGNSRADQSDCAFTIDNPHPPAAIVDLVATLADSAIHLSWTAITQDTAGNPIAVAYYTVYRNMAADFSPGPADSIGHAADTFYVDTSSAVQDTTVNHYYAVKAVDSQERRSVASNRVGEFDRVMTNHP